MDIKAINKENCLELVPLFIELECYYFKEDAASENELTHYLKHQVFSEHSSIKIIAAYERDSIIGFASYTVMYPAPKLSGQMYMKDLFVSSIARGKGVGIQLMKHLATLAVTSGCQRLDWTAENTNPIAGQFYRSIGAAHLVEKEYYRFESETLKAFSLPQ
ncbi:GNAT family N-acetyltransferase [Vibrio jasicida]|uniref:GNAT family N-acetyltransferase n=1 Tax=Vibrio jasicida TaxID=766224 RepID=UPI0003A2859C|nr:GNAT family N-acetyltransferase [Vibrio jasicida]